MYRAAQRWATKIVQELPGTRSRARPRAVNRGRAGLIEGAAQDTAVVKLGLLETLGAVLDDESRKTEREFRLRWRGRCEAKRKARCGRRVEIWAGIWLATISHALKKVVAGDWKPGDAGVRLVRSQRGRNCGS